MASRTYFASQCVGIMIQPAPQGSGAAFNRNTYSTSSTGRHYPLGGVQSVGLSTSIDFTQLFELGHLQLFENIEGVATCEVTIERSLPSSSYTMYQLIAKNDGNLTVNNFDYSGQFNGFASDNPVDVRLAMHPSGTPIKTQADATACQMLHISGFTSSYGVSASLDGAVTETLTILGTDLHTIPSGNPTLVPSGGGGGNSLPYRGRDCGFYIAQISGVNGQGQANAVSSIARGQSFSISLDVGREDLQELGSKQPYLRYASFPSEVTADFEYNLDLSPSGANGYGAWHTLSSSFDTFSSESACDINPPSGYIVGLTARRYSVCDPNATPEESEAGKLFRCAISGAKLTSQSLAGGDTGGGPVTVSQSYQAFNNLTSHVDHTT